MTLPQQNTVNYGWHQYGDLASQNTIVNHPSGRRRQAGLTQVQLETKLAVKLGNELEGRRGSLGSMVMEGWDEEWGKWGRLITPSGE